MKYYGTWFFKWAAKIGKKSARWFLIPNDLLWSISIDRANISSELCYLENWWNLDFCSMML